MLQNTRNAVVMHYKSALSVIESMELLEPYLRNLKLYLNNYFLFLNLLVFLVFDFSVFFLHVPKKLKDFLLIDLFVHLEPTLCLAILLLSYIILTKC